jgi:predicted transcriptional regulator
MTAEEEARAEGSQQTEEGVQAARILAVIQRHPEGVSIVDIGNELGVDWRSLITALQPLVEERKIERINTVYYPGEKAGEEEL